MEIRSRAGAEMARIRKAKGMTQAELGQEVTVSQRMIAAIEGGERRPSPDLAQRIGSVLGFPWTRFYDDEKSDNVDAFQD